MLKLGQRNSCSHNLSQSACLVPAVMSKAKLLEAAHEAQRRVLGAEHPDTLTLAHNLASVLREQGEFSEAARIHRETLEVRRCVLRWHKRRCCPLHTLSPKARPA